MCSQCDHSFASLSGFLAALRVMRFEMTAVIFYGFLAFRLRTQVWHFAVPCRLLSRA